MAIDNTSKPRIGGLATQDASEAQLLAIMRLCWTEIAYRARIPAELANECALNALRPIRCASYQVDPELAEGEHPAHLRRLWRGGGPTVLTDFGYAYQDLRGAL